MSFEDRVRDLVAEVQPVDAAARNAARQRHEGLAKPAGSLGQLETLGAQLAAITRACPPPVPQHPAIVVAAADHGVHAQSVTPWPQHLTAAMVRLICDGGAAVNAIAAAVGAQVSVLDVGVGSDLPDHPRLRSARVRAGTADLASGPAMTREDAARAILAGAGLVEELAGGGADLFVTGDMGIGNTTAAACLLAAFTGTEAAAVTGPGAGADGSMTAHKTTVVAAALALHEPDPADPLGVLASLGGLEHAALAGVILSAAAEGLPVVLDGVTTNAAALAACALCPDAADYLVAGHRSTEPGATVALEFLGREPLLELGLRLGEGTGGALAVPLVVAAAGLLGSMAALHSLQA